MCAQDEMASDLMGLISTKSVKDPSIVAQEIAQEKAKAGQRGAKSPRSGTKSLGSPKRRRTSKVPAVSTPGNGSIVA